MKKHLNKEKKREFEPKVIPILEEIANKLGLLAKQMNLSNPSVTEKDKLRSELKINIRLTTQKRISITNETVKTLNITWKDKRKYKDFIRYNLTNEKLMMNNSNERAEKENYESN